MRSFIALIKPAWPTNEEISCYLQVLEETKIRTITLRVAAVEVDNFYLSSFYSKLHKPMSALQSFAKLAVAFTNVFEERVS